MSCLNKTWKSCHSLLALRQNAPAEIMMVVAIIALLAAIAVPGFLPAKDLFGNEYGDQTVDTISSVPTPRNALALLAFLSRGWDRVQLNRSVS